MESSHFKKVILTGGGTGGPVTPLLAVADDLKVDLVHKFQLLWIGTKKGPEKEMVEENKIDFRAINSGKFRRYFSWQNLIDPFLILAGFFESLIIMYRFKPDLIISAGGFVSVPVAYAAWLFRVPIIIHQMDVRPTLSNKIIAPIAKIITTTFEKSVADYGRKAEWTGNPVRKEFRTIDYTTDQAREELGISGNKQVIMVLGGGTGALAINNLIWGNLKALLERYQVIHITGAGKNDPDIRAEGYHQYEFLDAKLIRMAYDISDVVISRCGLGVLTELSYLGKLAILIPIPDSHQEENAEIYYRRKAAIVLDQNELTAKQLLASIEKLITEYDYRSTLRNNIKKVIEKGGNEKMLKVINEVIK